MGDDMTRRGACDAGESLMGGCTYAECYVPESRHESCAAHGLGACWGKLEHQHTPKRSQGGKTCYVMLCSGHHDCIDNGNRYEGYKLSDGIVEWAEKGRVYEIRNRDTEYVVREIKLAPETGAGVLQARGGDSSADGPSTPAPVPAASFEQWVEHGRRLTIAIDRLRQADNDVKWEIGDWLVEGEDKYEPECWQFVETLKRKEQSLSQYTRVSRAFPPEARDERLSWSAHRVLAYALEDPSERSQRLSDAVERGLTRDELAAEVKGHTEVQERERCPECGKLR